MTAKDNRKAALAQIHIAKKQLGLDEELYRDMLENLTGKRSAGDMALAELYKVIKHLENVGFKRNRGGQPKSRRKQYYSPRAQGQIIDVMRAVWIEMHRAGIVRDGSESALTAYAKRMSSQLNGGIGVDSLDWLERDTKLAVAVLEALKGWDTRVRREWQREDFELIRTLQAGRNVAELVRELLAEHRIMWWPEFDERLGIESGPNYCTNREELNRGD
jgi:phage gp16-like protein